MLIQPVNNYQNNHYYNNSFKAQIIKTDYLQKGLQHVQNKPLNIQSEFLCILEHIANDNAIKTFLIKNDYSGRKNISIIQADNEKYTDPHDEIAFVSFANTKDGMVLTEGGLCIGAIRNFIEKHYGEKTLNKLERKGKKQVSYNKMTKLYSQMKKAKTKQEAQQLKQQYDAKIEIIKKGLADRFSHFTTSLIEP